MRRPLAASLLASSTVVVGVGLYAVGSGALPSQQDAQFCTLSGYLGLTDMVEEYDDVILADRVPASIRESCRGYDLHHFSAGELAMVDGIMFDDCVISWTAGGRSKASDLGIPCDPDEVVPLLSE